MLGCDWLRGWILDCDWLRGWMPDCDWLVEAVVDKVQTVIGQYLRQVAATGYGLGE